MIDRGFFVVSDRFPNAVKLRGPDGVVRHYVPIPDPDDPAHDEIAAVNTYEILRRRKYPLSVAELGRLMGYSRDTIYRSINQGEFPSESILKTPHGVRIQAAAALWYFESRIKE